MMNTNDKIYVAGHRGMVGSAITRKLQQEGFTRLVQSRSTELDLRDQHAVNKFFEKERPDFVFMAAAKVGGILANNTYRAEFIYDNIMIQENIIHASWHNGVKKLLFLGSSCIYPKLAPQPLKEEYLLTGELEYTNEPYAIAKIAGIKTCDAYRAQYGCDFISVMPTNLYGPNDNYDLEKSHVLPALIRKIHEAAINDKPSVVLWGTGTPRREFLHADDLAHAFELFINSDIESDLFNIGGGPSTQSTLLELTRTLGNLIGRKPVVDVNDQPETGQVRYVTDISKLETALSWHPRVSLVEGLKTII